MAGKVLGLIEVCYCNWVLCFFISADYGEIMEIFGLWVAEVILLAFPRLTSLCVTTKPPNPNPKLPLEPPKGQLEPC